MKEGIEIVKNLQGLIIPFSVIIGSFIIGLIVRKLIMMRLVALSQRTRTKVDDIVIAEINRPFLLWILLIGLYFACHLSELNEEWLGTIDTGILVLAIFSVTVFLSRLSIALIKMPSGRLRQYLPESTLTETIARIFIYVFGILIILNTLGISITPLLTAFGIGGLAVALALQDTLSNFFSGFYITLSKQVRVGDFVKLESGEEGYVVDIGWRTTRVRMLPNNVVVIPNAKFASSIITNYYFPEQEMAVLVQVGVHYESDLEHVERVTIEVGKDVMQTVQGGVPGFTPFIRYHTFADFSINFTVILRAKEFVDNYLIKHEFIKRLHRRYAQEGINIPYPIRALNYTQEHAQQHLAGQPSGQGGS